MSNLAKSLVLVLDRPPPRLQSHPPLLRALSQHRHPRISNPHVVCVILLADTEPTFLRTRTSSTPCLRRLPRSKLLLPRKLLLPNHLLSMLQPWTKRKAPESSQAGLYDTASCVPNVTCFRRVREAPGGNSTLGRIWGDDEPEETKPSPRAVDVSAVAPAEKQENTTAGTGIKPSRCVQH